MIELSARVGRLSSDVDTTVALLRMFDTGPLGGRGGHEGDQRVAQGLLHGVLGGTVEGDACCGPDGAVRLPVGSMAQ
jgi:hypothetical protein